MNLVVMVIAIAATAAANPTDLNLGDVYIEDLHEHQDSFVSSGIRN